MVRSDPICSLKNIPGFQHFVCRSSRGWSQFLGFCTVLHVNVEGAVQFNKAVKYTRTPHP